MAKTEGASGADVRAFANANNIPVGARGRFSADLIEAFNKGKRGAKRYSV